MSLRAVALGALSLVLFLSAGARTGFARKSRDDEEAKLQSKIEHESNPVKKAKLETKLGRLKLQQAFSSYDHGHYNLCWKLLDEYTDRMNNAWEDLVASGHQAVKKPDGFKQLDIALRESRRDLQDFERRITFQERQAAEKVAAQTVVLRNRVLSALFPGNGFRQKKESRAGSQPPASDPEKEPQ
jgi:hypothetical protein